MTDKQAAPVKRVSIRQAFYNKNARLARLLPSFVFRYLERIAHEKDINDFLGKYGHLYGIEFARAAIMEFGVRVEVKGDENLDRQARYLFACNHPLGGFDGLVMMDVLSRYYHEVKFLSNDLLMNIVNLHPVFLPINKHGRQGGEAVRLLAEAFDSGCQIVTFPSGYVSRYVGGQVMDLDWKKNFITKAVQHRRDVVPVFFSGRNSAFFYRLYRLRKFLGIKTNLEMLYLVDETYKHRNDSFVVTFGKPVSYTHFSKDKTPLEWAKWVKEQVYALGGITHVPL